ncbi:phosphotransferase enzyme family-domain-containing protein [Emericellopsis atlantica]|uniref:Phosphotransferase enzyme family-domain-containing protein n=1 Tax=Emericellopsis atlantica TaxID=2614577 RepID=A0A9P7ZRF8_9HYPO|nr:phosphotransferase enzyme family-domain-containing protein [Emericellopsis atlantica]KAG9256325.1 phosphotransferase enzyme family-domain-containing protein [Emericellopsis atlantica]
MPRSMQDGLGWQQTPSYLLPLWTRDPLTGAIENVSRQQLKTPPGDPCTVTFHAEGLFNKVYLVHTAGRSFIMRVTLPVYPCHKTRAEIGFEWILMEYMEGTPARKRWRTMSMEQKVALTKRFASFQFELSGLEKQESAFTRIRTLESPEIDLQVDSKVHEAAAAPGRLVSQEFFMGDRLRYDIPRGPFRSSHDWLRTLLTIIIRHQTLILEKSEDEDDMEEAEGILPVAQTLLTLLPQIFPPDLTSWESSALYHHDLNLNNILLNEQGEVIAVLDWECVSALPLWMLSRVPTFLDDQPREEEPQRNSYMDKTPEEAAAEAKKRNDPDDLDNEGKNQLYWIHKMEYEKTQLRKVCKAKMMELCPEWAEESPLKNDFYEAVSQCDGLWWRKARGWAECMEKGESVRFKDL